MQTRASVNPSRACCPFWTTCGLLKLKVDGAERAISHVRGATKRRPLLDVPIGTLFDQQAAKYDTKELLNVIDQDVTLSWVDFKKRADAFAAGLLKMGFEKGDRLGVWMPNTSEWAIAALATAKIGIVLVNINPSYRSHELKYVINLVGIKGLVVSPTFKTSNYIDILQDIYPLMSKAKPGAFQSEDIPSLKWVIHNGPEHIADCIKFDDVYNEQVSNVLSIQHTLDCHDAINIQFTSGTTGSPKGATLTHHNILNNGLLVGDTMKLTDEDIMCIPVPLYHCFGLVLGNLAAITHGASMVYPSKSFEPLSVLKAVQDKKCTTLHSVPTMFFSLLNHPNFKEHDVSTLRSGIMAGSTCPKVLMSRVMKELHMKEVCIAYGMTETSPVSFMTAATDPFDLRTETVGRVLDHSECKLVDPDGCTVPISQTGELLTRGYSVMKGYWGQEDKTKSSIQQGWMHSGDLGVFDENGYCRIIGRIKDMIIRGGENIYPREIEEFLHTHPNVSDVQVIGVPDEKYGEQVCAWIKLHEKKDDAEEELRTFCKDKISHFKVPRYFHFVDDFPMTITGKVQKFRMREITVEKLHLSNKL